MTHPPRRPPPDDDEDALPEETRRLVLAAAAETVRELRAVYDRATERLLAILGDAAARPRPGSSRRPPRGPRPPA